MSSWYPLGIRESGEQENYDALSEGVPEWIRAQAADLITEGLASGAEFRVDIARVRDCGAALRRTLPIDDSKQKFRQYMQLRAEDDPLLVLSVLDWILKVEDDPWYPERAEDVLSSGNSAWTVGEWGDGHIGLVRRVDATATTAAAQAISAKTTASYHLAEAWQAGYGLNGKPSSAYSHAIKAVEAAAIPVVSPKNGSATLGTVIGQVRADGDWIIPLTREKDPGHVAGMLLSMLEALWVGQSDRHGSPLPPISITSEAAQAAVLMATTLVQWFQSGTVRRGVI